MLEGGWALLPCVGDDIVWQECRQPIAAATCAQGNKMTSQEEVQMTQSPKT